LYHHKFIAFLAYNGNYYYVPNKSRTLDNRRNAQEMQQPPNIIRSYIKALLINSLTRPLLMPNLKLKAHASE